MSEAAHVPFSETKAPESAERLHRGALGLVDISASTMANIGPAYSFYFGFAGIVALVGVASPLVLVAAVIAIALLGNTLSQFSRAHPSTGGFITFVGKTFGGTSAVTTALVAGAGFFIGFELLVLLVVSVAVLIKNGGHLSSVPFQPSHITNHFSGLALAFPLAIYLFIGWENSAALAEETNHP